MKATRQTIRKTSLKKTAGKIPFFVHLLTPQESQEVVGGQTLKFPSDIDETNRLRDY